MRLDSRMLLTVFYECFTMKRKSKVPCCAVMLPYLLDTKRLYRGTDVAIVTKPGRHYQIKSNQILFGKRTRGHLHCNLQSAYLESSYDCEVFMFLCTRLNLLTPTVCNGYAAKHPAPDRVKTSFVIIDIRAL